MIKTITLDGLTSVTIKQSAYDMARFCWLYNHSESDIFASCVNSECTENADNVLRIPAGEPRMLDTESYETLYLNGSGTVELITSAYSVCPFNRAAKGGGASLSGSAAYTINNAVDYPLMGLNLYGKSTQDGTPSPDNPVDIVSVGDNGFDIITKDDTHFNILSVRDNGGEIITKQPVSAVGKNGETKQFIVSASGSGLTYQWWQNTNNGNGWVVIDAESARKSTFSIASATFRNGYKYRCVVTDSNGNSETSNEVTLYVVSDDCEITTASIATDALSLCGIPVDSGGNYTDSTGQQWICDELVYNSNGSGKIVKKIGKVVFDGSEEWSKSGITEIDRYILRKVSNINLKITVGLCNTYTVDISETSSTELGKILLYPNYYDQISINFSEYGTSTVETFKDYLKNNPIVLCTDLIEPQEIALTSAEISALKTLQTFNETTSISNSDNAEMDVKYCTNKNLSECVIPITTALQAQIDELKSAVLSLGGNI